MRVNTVDGTQGQENDCIILDLVLAKKRVGGPGIVSDAGRLSAALTKCKNMQITIGDLHCLDGEISSADVIAGTEDGNRANAVVEGSRMWDNTWNTKLFELYWREDEATITLHPKTLDVANKLVDWEPAEAYLEELIKERAESGTS